MTPAEAIVIETAGLTYPFDKLRVNNNTNVNAAPIAKGLPVANTTYTKKMALKNSTKYPYIYDRSMNYTNIKNIETYNIFFTLLRTPPLPTVIRFAPTTFAEFGASRSHKERWAKASE